MDKIGRSLGLTPRSVFEVIPTELLSKNSSLGLPLGLEAPVMTLNGVLFFLFFLRMQQGDVLHNFVRQRSECCSVL